MKISFKLLLLFTLLLVSSNAFSEVDVVELKKDGSSKLVVKVRFNNGSITDPPGKEGLTALTASLMMEGGTNEYTKAQINDLIYPMAAKYSSHTDKEVSTFTFSYPKAFSSEFYPILIGLLLHPSFEESDFNRLKSNTLNYLSQVIRASSDEEFSKKALEEMLFQNTPYSHMVAGTVNGIEAITLEDVKGHYQQFFIKNNVSFGIAGDFSKQYVHQLKNDLEGLSGVKIEIAEMPKIAMSNGIHVKIIEKKDALGSAIFAGYPIDITRANDQFAALMIANSWLGEHRKSYSRLYQKIRETRSMNYGDYTYIEWYHNGGRNQLPPSGVPRMSNYFSIWIRPVQIASQLKEQYSELSEITIGHAHFALRLAIREMDLLVQDGMDEQEFEKTKQFLRSYIKLYIQTPAKELGFLMDSRFYGRQDYIAELDVLLENTTLEQVNEAMRTYIQTKNMNVMIVTDDSEAELLAESLRKNKTSKMSYAKQLKAELPEDVLIEDAMVEKYPLNVTSVEVISSEVPFLK